jgi:hypothetical protein
MSVKKDLQDREKRSRCNRLLRAPKTLIQIEFRFRAKRRTSHGHLHGGDRDADLRKA